MIRSSQTFSVLALIVVLFTISSCSSDDEELSTEAAITGTWTVTAESLTVDGVTAQELGIPREVTGVPSVGSTMVFSTDKSLVVTDGDVTSNSTWRAGEERNVFITYQEETVETEFALQAMTGNSVTIFHTSQTKLDQDPEADVLIIDIDLVRK